MLFHQIVIYVLEKTKLFQFRHHSEGKDRARALKTFHVSSQIHFGLVIIICNVNETPSSQFVISTTRYKYCTRYKFLNTYNEHLHVVFVSTHIYIGVLIIITNCTRYTYNEYN